MNYEIEMLLNIQSGFTEKPQSQTGLLSYPQNYMTNFWNVIRVKRLKDNVLIYKNFTKTDKGDVLFIRIECPKNEVTKCMLVTSVGKFDIDDVTVLNGL
jgi:hypothetical protein